MDPTLLFTVLGIIVTAIVPFIGYIYKTRKDLRNFYSVIWKKSNKLKAKELLGERPCEDYYYERNVDSFITRALERRRNALIVGPPLSGKTRAIYHSLKNYKTKFKVLIPRSVSMPAFQFPTDYSLGKNRLIFIDDLQYYIERQDSYHLFFREAKERNIPIIAACHSGREFKKVKNKMTEQNMDIDIIFGDDIMEMEKISAEEGRKVAEKLGMKWDNVKFNGTIGSIFMRLSEMERRFDNCDTIEKTILRSLRILYKCGIYHDNSLFNIEWIKKTAGVFELEGKDFEWTGWFKALEDKEFIKLSRKNRIWAEDAYLEFVVKPEAEISQLDMFEIIHDVFNDDAEVLQMAGERAYDAGAIDSQIGDYMKYVIIVFDKILGLRDKEKNGPEYFKAQNYLGQAYWSLSKVKDTLVNCSKSISYYNEILETITLSSNPFEYAKIKNRIGNTFTAFAEVEDREKNCTTAIESYYEALKVFTIDQYPQDYARAFNNLGGAYIILSEVKDPVKNYKLAIDAFYESLKVRTMKDYPIVYALTKNNIANSYAKLSEYEETEKNLNLAIETYEDVLTIHTKEKSPLQYGLTMNNIGNAFSLLAFIKDKKGNCIKAIRSFEKALEIRTLEQMPVQYANTMFNMADAYLVQNEEDRTPETLDKAITAFEESLKVRTKEDYPIQHAEAIFGLGRAYIRLAEFEDKSENYNNAIRAFDEALAVFAEEKYPRYYEMIQEEISKAKKIFFL
ncbi:MAG: tetratricopeptide repeat protein [Ignavibacteria bacterium]|nr:tetratricopeptide repeat protein [Ignavibacteria bacterium]